MVTNEKLDNICKKTINGETLTTNCLKECGLNLNDIKKLINDNFITKVKRAEYKLSNVEYLYRYSKKLSSLNDIENAIKGFLICYEINPSHSDTCLWLFIKSLIEEDYESVFKYFEGFYESNNELEKKDNLFLLYMLSFLTNIPDKYINELKQIDFKKIKIIDPSVEDAHLLNCLRFHSMHTKYGQAKRFLSEKKANQGSLSMLDLATMILIEKAKKIHDKKIKKIKDYILNEDYDSIIALLNSNRKKEGFGLENKVLNLAIIAQKIRDTKEIPRPFYVMTNNTVEAIEYNNFDLALKLSIEFSKKSGFKNEDNVIYLMLDNIVKMINKIKNTAEEVSEKQTNIESTEEYKKNTTLLEKNFINLRENHGITILKPMPKEKRDMFINIIETTEDISYKEIGVSEPRRLVLIYAPNKNKFIYHNPIIKEADKLYREYSFKKALEKYRIILESGKPSAYIFAKIGLCCLKISSKKNAIDFLTIATEMSQEFGDGFDFTDLICKLNKKELDENNEVKKRVKMNEKEFESDIDSFYGIEDIEKIAELVRNGMTIEEIADRFELTSEQISIVKLIFARECYITGNFELGDFYLKKVEQSKNKTNFVKKMMEDIIKNKKFYMHRDLSNHKTLSLLLTKKD